MSRQREWLADASSVQFTRQTTGLAGALKKIAGLPDGSQLERRARRAAGQPHALRRGQARIRADVRDAPAAARAHRRAGPGLPRRRDRAAAAAVAPAAARRPGRGRRLGPRRHRPVAGRRPAAAPPARTGAQPDGHARRSRRGQRARRDDDARRPGPRRAAAAAQLPPAVRTAASQGSTAVPLVLALLLDAAPTCATGSCAACAARLGPGRRRRAAPALAPLGGRASTRCCACRSSPSPLRSSPPARRASAHALGTALDELARADGAITVFEYCLTRLVGSYLGDAADPPRARGRDGRRCRPSATPR